MSGMIYKNFYVNRWSFISSVGIQILCSAVIILACSFMSGKEFTEDRMTEMTFFMTLTYFLASMLPGMLTSEIFKNDESRVCCSFAMSVPAGAKGHVMSKYFYILIVNLIILFFGFITDTVTVAITDGNISITAVLVLIFCWRIFISAIEMPFMIRFGSQRGLSIKGAVVAAVLVVFWVYFLFGDISFMFDSEDPFQAFLTWLQSGDIVFCLSLFPYVSIAAYYASFRISLKLYGKGAEGYEQ